MCRIILLFYKMQKNMGLKIDKIGGKFKNTKCTQEEIDLCIPVLKSSELRSKNKTGLCCSMPSGGSLSAGAPGTPDPGAGTYK